MVTPSNLSLAYTISSIADDAEFIAATVPMPIIVADERAPGQLLIPANSTVYEFNPWEMGTFDSRTFGFAPLRYVGSRFIHGALPDHRSCVRGFDNAGFIMGTSSSLFNQAFLQINASSGGPDRVKT